MKFYWFSYAYTEADAPPAGARIEIRPRRRWCPPWLGDAPHAGARIEISQSAAMALKLF